MRKKYKMRSSGNRVCVEAILVAEACLGRKLPFGACVHHVDENGFNNTPSNLVICPDRAYHNLIHQRMRSLDACGHVDWRKCPYCKLYDDPVYMVEQKRYGRDSPPTMIHKECKADYMRRYLRTYRKEENRDS